MSGKSELSKDGNGRTNSCSDCIKVSVQLAT